MRLRLVVCLIIAVAGSVACHGLSIAELMFQLSSADSGQRTEAREGLLSLGATAVPSLIEATTSASALLRWEAVNLLGSLGDLRATDAVLLVAMSDPDVHARWRSNWAITNLDDGSVVPRLVEGLAEDDSTIAWNCAVTLSLFGALDAVPALHAGLTATDWRQWEAVNALGRVWSDETVILLLPVLEEGSENVRKEAALSLGRIGGTEALVALLSALEGDPSAEVRWRAAMMIGSIGDPSAIPRLQDARPGETDPFVIDHIDKAIERLSRDSYSS
ncbi:MAG: HEAT repeat domain-containing protein [Candidatus Bipolaricaulia bacterium]